MVLDPGTPSPLEVGTAFTLDLLCFSVGLDSSCPVQAVGLGGRPHDPPLSLAAIYKPGPPLCPTAAALVPALITLGLRSRSLRTPASIATNLSPQLSASALNANPLRVPPLLRDLT